MITNSAAGPRTCPVMRTGLGFTHVHPLRSARRPASSINNPPRTPRTVFALFAATLLSALAAAQPTLRVPAIPDENPTQLQRMFAPLGKYLVEKIGMKAASVPVTDYGAIVEALAAKKIDMVWYGGFTFVQARLCTSDAIPIVQREEDEKFRSVFITANPEIAKLSDLQGKT